LPGARGRSERERERERERESERAFVGGMDMGCGHGLNGNDEMRK